MNKINTLVLAILLSLSVNANAAEVCEVKICNKIERFSLSITSHIKDSIGETCFNVKLNKEDAIVGKIINEESRWYQGSSINITKKSVTRVKEVYSCENLNSKDAEKE